MKAKNLIDHKVEKKLQIIIKCSLKRVDSSDVTLNWNDDTYHSFHKPTEEATSDRINLFLSNLTMPCKLPRKFPRLIEKRLSGLSSIKRILENLKDYHEQRRITQKENKEINPKYRKGSILWFIPSYRKSVKTNILKLVFKKLFLHYQNQIFMYSQHQIKNYYTQQN